MFFLHIYHKEYTILDTYAFVTTDKEASARYIGFDYGMDLIESNPILYSIYREEAEERATEMIDDSATEQQYFLLVENFIQERAKEELKVEVYRLKPQFFNFSTKQLSERVKENFDYFIKTYCEERTEQDG